MVTSPVTQGSAGEGSASAESSGNPLTLLEHQHYLADPGLSSCSWKTKADDCG